MIGGGSFLALHTFASCTANDLVAELLGEQTCGPAWIKLGAGAGVAAIGVLLATVWSDVPVVRNVTLTPTQDAGGVQVAAAFQF